jgi:hypothetical protein
MTEGNDMRRPPPPPRRISAEKIRKQARLDYQELPLEQRKKLTAAFKRDRQSDPKLDWAEWLMRAQGTMRTNP